MPVDSNTPEKQEISMRFYAPCDTVVLLGERSLKLNTTGEKLESERKLMNYRDWMISKIGGKIISSLNFAKCELREYGRNSAKYMT